MNRVLGTALAVGVVALAACDPGSTGTDITGGLPATHYAWLEGRVFTASGAGVAFAPMAVRIPSGRSPNAYVVAFGGQTAATGDYDLVLQRVRDVGTLPTPDTLSVFLLVQQQTSAGPRLDSTQTTLTFHPVGEVSDPQRVDLHTSVP